MGDSPLCSSKRSYGRKNSCLVLDICVSWIPRYRKVSIVIATVTSGTDRGARMLEMRAVSHLTVVIQVRVSS